MITIKFMRYGNKNYTNFRGLNVPLDDMEYLNFKIMYAMVFVISLLTILLKMLIIVVLFITLANLNQLIY